MLHWKEYIYIRISIYEYILNHMGFIQHHTTAKTLFGFLCIHQPSQTSPPPKKKHMVHLKMDIIFSQGGP